MIYLTTLHIEDHATRTGRVRSKLVTTYWHMPVTLESAAADTIAQHPERKPRGFRLATESAGEEREVFSE